MSEPKVKHTQSKKYAAMLICVGANLLVTLIAIVAAIKCPEAASFISSITSTFVGSVSFAISVYFGGQSMIDYKVQSTSTTNTEIKKEELVKQEIQKNMTMNYGK